MSAVHVMDDLANITFQPLTEEVRIIEAAVPWRTPPRWMYLMVGAAAAAGAHDDTPLSHHPSVLIRDLVDGQTQKLEPQSPDAPRRRERKLQIETSRQVKADVEQAFAIAMLSQTTWTRYVLRAAADTKKQRREMLELSQMKRAVLAGRELRKIGRICKQLHAAQARMDAAATVTLYPDLGGALHPSPNLVTRGPALVVSASADADALMQQAKRATAWIRETRHAELKKRKP